MKAQTIFALLICLAPGDRLPAAASGDANWPQFRGPNGSGVANACKPPVKVVADRAAWKAPLPPGKSSPVLWNGRIFLTGVEAGRLATLALDAKSGKFLWKKLAPEVRLESVHTANSVAASTPCADERRVYVYFFDWRDGNHDGFWTKEEFIADLTVGLGRPNLTAIRPGGTGDITESHVSWNLRNGIPEISSPVLHSGRLYLIRDGRMLSCVNATTGEVVYRERLGAAGQYSASPVVANGHVYLVSSKGMLTVVKTGDKFVIAHQADLKASVAATPAMDPSSLYVRADDAMLAFR